MSSPYRALGGLTTLKAGLHWHTTNSDGLSSPTAMVEKHVALGYDVCMCTDHDTITADPQVDGILYISGCEELCLGDTWQDVVCANVSQQYANNDAQGAINAAPLAWLAHPFNATIKFTVAEMLALTGYIGIEIEPGEAITSFGWDDLLTAGRTCWGLLVDDAHQDTSIGTKGWVILYAEAATVAAVLAALANGKFYATQGPTLTIIDTGCYLQITADAACDFTFIGTGGAILATTPNATTAQYAYRAADGYVRAVAARVADGKQAFTNAITVS